ncbi:hypothetical protein O3Q52_15220 [Streptomyces sp. ActVer]|uniref:hypothetical protein n=1 Tax=Streptomyces sp. ActVer TaxID=3014558 RepID=UPI0022B4A43A|nr:hypothetical protein [Streptomyces sp. ActVer]MCZ4509523.1 hypothetical protein [Streptomyces sp. ActVer]
MIPVGVLADAGAGIETKHGASFPQLGLAERRVLVRMSDDDVLATVRDVLITVAHAAELEPESAEGIARCVRAPDYERRVGGEEVRLPADLQSPVPSSELREEDLDRLRRHGKYVLAAAGNQSP